MEALRNLEIPIRSMRVGNDNLFQSAVFANTIASLMQVEIELLSSSGAIGAAKAAGVSVGIYKTPEEALSQNLLPLKKYLPEKAPVAASQDAYLHWTEKLNSALNPA